MATNFAPILPLFPTPLTTTLPGACSVRTIASTALRKLSRHNGSVEYSRDRHDNAVASVDKTCAAFARISSAFGVRSESEDGGVIGKEVIDGERVSMSN